MFVKRDCFCQQGNKTNCFIAILGNQDRQRTHAVVINQTAASAHAK